MKGLPNLSSRMVATILLVLPVLLVHTGGLAQRTGRVDVLGYNEVLLDPQVFREQFGYMWVNANNVFDTIPQRTSQLVDVKIEVRIFSNFMDKYKKVAVHDAYYLSTAIGKVTSPTVNAQLPKGDYRREDTFAGYFTFGYDFFLGYRNKRWGLMAGVRPQWSYASLGDFSFAPTAGGFGLMQFAKPLALRGEFHPFSHFEYRIIATAWAPVIGGAPWSGWRIEVPTFPSRRIWLFAEWQKFKCAWSYLSEKGLPDGRFTSFQLGLRIGSIF